MVTQNEGLIGSIGQRKCWIKLNALLERSVSRVQKCGCPHADS